MFTKSWIISSLICVSAFAAPTTSGSNDSDLPVVDLKYELHQAISYNSTQQFYNFSNIRYAQPPVADLRFAAPQPPKTNRTEIQLGDQGRICPQASPGWFPGQFEFIFGYLGIPWPSSNASSSFPPLDPRTSEDCLFLDVLVPKRIWDSRQARRKAPVLVWIYGGGYATGEKSSFSGSPGGLLNRADNDIIFVSLNYRLGAFGFSSGPSFQAEGGVANAGLLDQRFALKWVQEHISKFGGDPNAVTVMGESAGGGSIMHQITAYGGLKDRAPFSRAILQSPGFLITTSSHLQETVFQKYLSLLNVSCLADARRLPTEALIVANMIQVNESTTGSYTYTPVVDGNFAPALPGQLLARGQFDKRVSVMHSFNSQEGLMFTPKFITDEQSFRDYIQQALPTIQEPTLDHLSKDMYPPVFNGSDSLYKDWTGLASLALSESVFTCNTRYLATAYNGTTYGYQFALYPGLHGQDIPFTFFDGNSVSVLGDVKTALQMQKNIVSFVKDGNPGFPAYGANATIQIFNNTNITIGADPNASERCAWWQKALYA